MKTIGKTLAAGVIFLSLFGVSRAEQAEGGAPAYPEQRLTRGDSVPVMSFTDIHGTVIANSDYGDWVVVYSFADRKSNKDLQKLVAPAGVEAARRYPGFKVVYINVADVVGVPHLFHPIVLPILRAIGDKHTKTMDEFYRERGVTLNPETSGFFMVPDWDGEHLKTFGLKDAKDYHCFVTYRSKVIAVFDPSDPPVTEKYVRAFAEAAPPDTPE